MLGSYGGGGATGSLTVTIQEAVNPPLTVVTVIVHDPTALPVTTPVLETVAFVTSDDDHVTALFPAFVGSTVAYK